MGKTCKKCGEPKRRHHMCHVVRTEVCISTLKEFEQDDLFLTYTADNSIDMEKWEETTSYQNIKMMGLSNSCVDWLTEALRLMSSTNGKEKLYIFLCCTKVLSRLDLITEAIIDNCETAQMYDGCPVCGRLNEECHKDLVKQTADVKEYLIKNILVDQSIELPLLSHVSLDIFNSLIESFEEKQTRPVCQLMGKFFEILYTSSTGIEN